MTLSQRSIRWNRNSRRLSDEALRAKTDEFRVQVAESIGNLDGLNEEEQFKAEQEALEDILPEAFAVVREVSKRTIGLRHFDIQLIGGVILHRGSIAEMRTGEGKTLVATTADLPQFTARKRYSPDYRERLPGAARCALDGADLRYAWAIRWRFANGGGNREWKESVYC